MVTEELLPSAWDNHLNLSIKNPAWKQLCFVSLELSANIDGLKQQRGLRSYFWRLSRKIQHGSVKFVFIA
jgi:hypothetical protein